LREVAARRAPEELLDEPQIGHPLSSGGMRPGLP
jgi:hypothetical protein